MLAMEIFNISKQWPAEEKYSLTDQIRRSSRSVCSNLRESWAKRRYEAHFISKLTDADGENSETDTWLDFARDCKYISIEDHGRLTTENRPPSSYIWRSELSSLRFGLKIISGHQNFYTHNGFPKISSKMYNVTCEKIISLSRNSRHKNRSVLFRQIYRAR